MGLYIEMHMFHIKGKLELARLSLINIHTWNVSMYSIFA